MGFITTMSSQPTAVATTPQITKAWNLDGADEYISVPDDDTLDITDNFSVEAIIELTSESNNEIIVTKRNTSGSDENISYQMYLTSAGYLNVLVVEDLGDSKFKEYTHNVDLTGAKHQVGFTFDSTDSGTLKLYVDGADVTGDCTLVSDNAMAGIEVTTQPLSIGKLAAGNPAAYAQGKIGRLLMYDTTTLTASDFANLWNSGSTTTDPSTVGSLALALLMESDDSTGAGGVIDASGNGNHGTANNMESGDLVTW